MRRLQCQLLRKPLAIMLGSAALLTSTLAASNDTAMPVKAIWKVHELDFAYMGITSYYSCDGLRDKVHSILLQLGARPDVWVRSGACDVISGAARMPSVRIVVALPVEATDDSLAAQKADANRAALIAKMQKAQRGKAQRGKASQRYSDDPFDAVATLTVISHKDRSSYGAVAGDCELLEQMARDLLPKMGIKIVRKDLSCMPHSTTLSANLQLAPLIAVSVNP